MDIRMAGSGPATKTGSPAAPRKELEVKPEAEEVADVYNSSRSIGNYVSGALLGSAAETASSLLQSPRLAWEIVENLWQAETLGPNLKTIGTVAALPLAALSIPGAALYGAVNGVMMVVHHRRDSESPLTSDTSAAVGREMTTREPGGQAPTMTGKLVENLEELGSRKLEAGAKPFDVPLLSPAFALVGGAVSGVVAGAVGLVAGLAAGAITGAKDVAQAFTGKDLGIGARVGKVVASPLNLVAGPVLAWKSVKEAVPRGLSDGWKHGLIRPLVDTARISASLGTSVIQEAWEK